jgi:hypothetical protein
MQRDAWIIKTAFMPLRPLVFLVMVTFFGCDFQQNANRKFADQHFKTAISLIELHKIRYGVYPESLQALRHLGEWDPIAVASVQYRRLDHGYELNLLSPFGDISDVSYPPDFWRGLGLLQSNMLRSKYQEGSPSRK